MGAPKGYPAQSKLDRLVAQYATVEPAGGQQHGLSVVAHQYVYSVGTDAVEANSTVSTINATAHAAQPGDVIRITSGTLNNKEVKVFSIATDSFTLCEDLSSAPANAVTFQILRHIYPVVGSDGSIAVASGPAQFTYNGATTNVLDDTVTPSNNRPLPVKLTSATGPINITAGDLNVQLSDLGASYDSTRIGDGTTLLGITVSNEAKVADATARTSLSSIDAKHGTLGQKAMAGSSPVVIANDQSTLPISAASLPLPSGASTETTLAAASAKLPATLGQKAMAASMAVVIASDQSAITVNSANTIVDFLDTPILDCGTTNIPSSASNSVQVVASLAAAVKRIRVNDTTGAFIGVYTGAVATPTLQCIIGPGMDGYIDVALTATSIISVRNMAAAAITTAGFQLCIQFLG